MQYICKHTNTEAFLFFLNPTNKDFSSIFLKKKKKKIPALDHVQEQQVLLSNISLNYECIKKGR